MKRKLIKTVENDFRKSSWFLVQNDDRTLSIEQEADYPSGDHKMRIVPINDFMRESGPPPRWVQELIDRMFDNP